MQVVNARFVWPWPQVFPALTEVEPDGAGVGKGNAQASRSEAALLEAVHRIDIESWCDTLASPGRRHIKEVDVTDSFVQELPQVQLADDVVALPDVQATVRVFQLGADAFDEPLRALPIGFSKTGDRTETTEFGVFCEPNADVRVVCYNRFEFECPSVFDLRSCFLF